MKTILQHDERDCGAACLAMVASHYGYSQSLNKFREWTNTTQDGTSGYDIIRAAESIGFTADMLTGSVEELLTDIEQKEIRAPFIAHVITKDNNYHFVVVMALSPEKVTVCDPAKGKRFMSIIDFSDQWTGKVIALIPNSTFKRQKETANGFWRFFSLLKDQLRRFVAIIVISVLISGIGIVGAFAFQIIIDHTSELAMTETMDEHMHHEHDVEYLTDSELLNNTLERISDFIEHLNADSISFIFMTLIGLYAFAAVIQYVRGRLIINMSKQIDMALSLPYFNRIVDLPLAAVLKRKTGDYLSRYTDISAIRNAISTATITLIIDTIMAIGCGIILFLQSPRLALTAGSIIMIYAVLVIGNRKRIQDSNRTFMEKNACVQAYMKESIDGVETIKTANAAAQAKTTMQGKFSDYLHAAIRKSRIIITQEAIITGVETIGIAAILWQGFSLVTNNALTLGSLITFYALLGYLITPVKNLIELQPVIQSATVAGERLDDVMEMQSERIDGKNMKSIDFINRWDVSDLCFGYGNQDLQLKNISFSIEKGEMVALVGESGSGKTTLAKMFSRLYEPESGYIFADGVSLQEYSLGSLRDTVAYVSNDTSLFSGSIYDYLRLGNPECTDEDIRIISNITRISDFIGTSPDAEQFYIEEGGTNLSSGQKQRIAITRALLKKPKLLILDEATTNMPSKAEENLIKGIRQARPDLTLLVVTHRLTAVQNYDKIIVMNDGGIASTGTHLELLGNSEVYQSLLSTTQ